MAQTETVARRLPGSSQCDTAVAAASGGQTRDSYRRRTVHLPALQLREGRAQLRALTRGPGDQRAVTRPSGSHGKMKRGDSDWWLRCVSDIEGTERTRWWRPRSPGRLKLPSPTQAPKPPRARPPGPAGCEAADRPLSTTSFRRRQVLASVSLKP